MLTHVSIVNFGVQVQNNRMLYSKLILIVTTGYAHLIHLKHMEFWKASGVLVVRELKPTSF